VPAAPPEGFVGVQTSLRLSVPLFFAPKNGEGRLTWTAGRNASGDLQLRVENRGTRFARLTRIRIRDASGREVAALGGPQYALTGAKRHWDFPGTAHLPSGMELKAIVEMGSARQEFPLQIE
jgi:P pilus assembly chaperone PapD